MKATILTPRNIPDIHPKLPLFTEKHLTLYATIEEFYTGNLSVFSVLALSAEAFAEKIAIQSQVRRLNSAILSEIASKNRHRVTTWLRKEMDSYNQRLITLNQFFFDLNNPKFTRHGQGILAN